MNLLPSSTKISSYRELPRVAWSLVYSPFWRVRRPHETEIK